MSHQNRRQKVFTIGGFCVCAGGLDILKIDKNSTPSKCFMFQFGGIGALFGRAKAPKLPRGDGTVSHSLNDGCQGYLSLVSPSVNS